MKKEKKISVKLEPNKKAKHFYIQKDRLFIVNGDDLTKLDDKLKKKTNDFLGDSLELYPVYLRVFFDGNNTRIPFKIDSNHSLYTNGINYFSLSQIGENGKIKNSALLFINLDYKEVMVKCNGPTWGTFLLTNEERFEKVFKDWNKKIEQVIRFEVSRFGLDKFNLKGLFKRLDFYYHGFDGIYNLPYNNALEELRDELTHRQYTGMEAFIMVNAGHKIIPYNHDFSAIHNFTNAEEIGAMFYYLQHNTEIDFLTLFSPSLRKELFTKSALLSFFMTNDTVKNATIIEWLSSGVIANNFKKYLEEHNEIDFGEDEKIKYAENLRYFLSHIEIEKKEVLNIANNLIVNKLDDLKA